MRAAAPFPHVARYHAHHLQSARPLAVTLRQTVSRAVVPLRRNFSLSVRRLAATESDTADDPKEDAACPKPPPLSTFHDAMTYSWRNAQPLELSRKGEDNYLQGQCVWLMADGADFVRSMSTIKPLFRHDDSRTGKAVKERVVRAIWAEPPRPALP